MGDSHMAACRSQTEHPNDSAVFQLFKGKMARRNGGRRRTGSQLVSLLPRPAIRQLVPPEPAGAVHADGVGPRGSENGSCHCSFPRTLCSRGTRTTRIVRGRRSWRGRWPQSCSREGCAKWRSGMSGPTCDRSSSENTDAGCGNCTRPSLLNQDFGVRVDVKGLGS
jgi:hypothetical protein